MRRDRSTAAPLPSALFPRQGRLCRGSRRGPKSTPVRPVPASGSPMPRLPPRPQDRPSFARFPRQGRQCRGSCRGPKSTPVRPFPASGSTMPRLQDRPSFARFPRQCRPCRGSRRGPKTAPRPPVSRVRVDHAAAPAAAPSSLSRGRRLCRRNSTSLLREKKNPAMPFAGLAGLIDRKK